MNRNVILKCMLIFITALALMGSSTCSVKASLVLDEELKISFEDGTKTGTLTDDNFNTYVDVSGKKLVVENTRNVSGIYFIWDKPVEEFTITVVDEKDPNNVYNSEVFSAPEIIHQYIDLYYEGDMIVIDMPKEAVLCDIYFIEFGEIPDWVQVWEEPYDSADMLFIPTHADDELLFFGGALPTYAGEMGLKVQVAYMTNHWNERYRPHELLNGLWTCGVTAYPVIGPFTDYYSESLEHAMTLYQEEDVEEFMVWLIRRFKPYVILGHDINGEYGHGVHRYNTYSLMKALEISSDLKCYPDSALKYGTWDVPKTYLHLYGENKIVMNWDEKLTEFNGLDGVEVAALAFECHKSQNTFYSVKRAKGSVYGCTEFGLYRTTVGEDIEKNDFMENIEPTKEIKQQIKDAYVAFVDLIYKIKREFGNE